MDWSQIGLLIVLSTIISAGGVGGIVVAVIKFSSDFIADKLQKKYELKFSKELEIYKTTLNNKSHISKTRFDKEFEIYQSISSEIMETVFESGSFILLLKTDAETKKLSESIVMVNEKYSKANATLIKFAPFIDSKIYDDYNDLCHLLRDFIVFSQCHVEVSEEGLTEFTFTNHEGRQKFSLSESKEKIIKMRKQISDKSDSILVSLRNYLSSRDVLEM